MHFMKRNLLEIGDGYLLNQVNCRGAYGGGIAAQITAKWPEAKQHYLQFCTHMLKERKEPLLGSYCIWNNWKDNTDRCEHIVHLFGQDTYGKSGRYTNYVAFMKALSKFRADTPQSVGRTYIPYKIGCGLGGGNWEVIKAIIDDITPDAIICVPPRLNAAELGES